MVSPVEGNRNVLSLCLLYPSIKSKRNDETKDEGEKGTLTTRSVTRIVQDIYNGLFQEVKSWTQLFTVVKGVQLHELSTVRDCARRSSLSGPKEQTFYLYCHDNTPNLLRRVVLVSRPCVFYELFTIEENRV